MKDFQKLLEEIDVSILTSSTPLPESFKPFDNFLAAVKEATNESTATLTGTYGADDMMPIMVDYLTTNAHALITNSDSMAALEAIGNAYQDRPDHDGEKCHTIILFSCAATAAAKEEQDRIGLANALCENISPGSAEIVLDAFASAHNELYGEYQTEKELLAAGLPGDFYTRVPESSLISAVHRLDSNDTSRGAKIVRSMFDIFFSQKIRHMEQNIRDFGNVNPSIMTTLLPCLSDLQGIRENAMHTLAKRRSPTHIQDMQAAVVRTLTTTSESLGARAKALFSRLIKMVTSIFTRNKPQITSRYSTFQLPAASSHQDDLPNNNPLALN